MQNYGTQQTSPRSHSDLVSLYPALLSLIIVISQLKNAFENN